MRLVILLRKFRLHFTDIHTRRAFGLAAFARQTKVQHLLHHFLIGPDLLLFIGRSEILPEYIGPRAGCIALTTGGHVAGAHGTAGQFCFPAITRSTALFGEAQYTLLSA